jgi:hypothetical protein
MFRISNERKSVFEEVYSSDSCEKPETALKQWLNRRKAGRKAFSRETEIECAIALGMCLAKRHRRFEFWGDILVINFDAD